MNKVVRYKWIIGVKIGPVGRVGRVRRFGQVGEKIKDKKLKSKNERAEGWTKTGRKEQIG